MNTAREPRIGSNEGVFLDESRIVRPDIILSDGVVHYIDRVLVPTSVLADSRNIFQIIDDANNGLDFFDDLDYDLISDLPALLKNAGLETTLRQAARKTFFAPTKEALAKFLSLNRASQMVTLPTSSNITSPLTTMNNNSTNSKTETY